MSIYCIVNYVDESIFNFKVYSTFEKALKEYVRGSLKEVRALLDEESEDDGEAATCNLQVLELDPDTEEYTVSLEYDIDSFQEYLAEQDDVDGYIEKLQDIVDNDEDLPEDLHECFSV